MTQATPFLLQERDGPVLILRMNRPDSRNALSEPSQMDEFVALADQVRGNPSIKVAILTGEGSAFCAGGNIKDMRDGGGMFGGSAYEIRGNYRSGIQRIPLALYNLDIPIIAAINGPAIGAGLDLACMCDIRIAANTAIFAESFVKLGIVPGDGGAWLLPRVIGMPKATVMALTGDTIKADTALAWDLVTELTEPDALIATALGIARRIAANPGHALRLTKKLLREGQHMRLDSLLELSAAFQALSHKTEDHGEAVAAFIEKRPPNYNDR